MMVFRKACNIPESTMSFARYSNTVALISQLYIEVGWQLNQFSKPGNGFSQRPISNTDIRSLRLCMAYCFAVA